MFKYYYELYRNEWFPSSRIDGRIQGLPCAEKLLDNWALRIDDPETGDVNGTVFFNTFVPTIIHHLARQDRTKSQI